ncbi:hypothetical protein ACQCSX_04160 [Pseudarthrobacter sp. P1]|uniref:hypothetical protein n=1 Tax=Pseudarthrobacter sp. P1 TaxID=3418418 RepID=UPI003CF62AA5
MTLKTAAEAAQQLGHITAHTIMGMAKRHEISYVRGPRGKVLLTDDQIAGIVEHLTQQPRTVEVTESQPMGIDSLTSARSQSLSKRAGR